MKHFIRHGESEGNVGPEWPTDGTPLTQRGRRQSVAVGKRLAAMHVGAILSSPLRRATETSQLISDVIGIPVKQVDLLKERRHPSELIGQRKEDPNSLFVYGSIQDNFHLPGFRFSDEETFDDLKVRSSRLLTYLSRREEMTVVVITHGFFMRVLLAPILNGVDLSGEACMRILIRFHVDNTGVSLSEYDGDESYSAWRIRTWNDRAHLPNYNV